MSAPIGPRIRPVITYDDDGMLTTYTGKTCSVCAVQLTSRNRYEAKLLCGEHGREHQRARIRRPGAARASSSRGDAAAAAVVLPDFERDRLGRLFNAWLRQPDFGVGRAVLLAAIKFNLDRFLVAGWFGRGWTIFDQSALRFYLWQSPLKEAEKPYFLSLLVVSLPFLWAGTVLTLRRLRSLGWRPFWVLLFFVPVVKFLFFAVLCILKSREEKQALPIIENSWDKLLGRILPRGTFGSATSRHGLCGTPPQRM